LSLRQLRQVLYVEAGDVWARPSREPQVDDILAFCSSFVRLSGNGDWIEFAQFTVEEYLKAIDPRKKPQLDRYRWEHARANVYLARTCLTYVNLENFQHDLLLNAADALELAAKHPFYMYACLTWEKHLASSKSGTALDGLVQKLFCLCSPPHHAFANWRQMRLLLTA
jgi:hypothetical protein